MIAAQAPTPALAALERQLLQPADGIPPDFFPPGVACILDTIERMQAPLVDSEYTDTARMVPVRLREFTAGRTAARAALRQLDHRDFAIPRRPDRSPQWPNGFCGSLSHSRTHVAAVVARIGKIATLGLDLEEDVRVTPDLWPYTATPEQLQQLHALPGPAALRLASLYFCAAEACYKALPAAQQRELLQSGKTSIAIALGVQPGEILAQPPGATAARPMSGRFAHIAGHWVALFMTEAC